MLKFAIPSLAVIIALVLAWLKAFYKRVKPSPVSQTYAPGKKPAKGIAQYIGLNAAPLKWMPFRLRWWGFWGNDRLGDCDFAACANAWKATSRYLHTKFALTLNQVEDAYQTYCNQHSGGQDAGADPRTVLQNWFVDGMWGEKILGWGPVNYVDLHEVQLAIYNFGACLLSVHLPRPAYTYQMRGLRRTWKLTGTPADDDYVGYHEILAVGYDAKFVYVLTWGVIVRVTIPWFKKYVLDANTLITPAVAQAGRFSEEQLSELQADLSTLNA